MHHCYPECKPQLGYHHTKSGSSSHETQLKNKISNLEKEIIQAKKGLGDLPVPENYEIKDVKEYGSYKILLVHYPNCTNFDGMKCLVVKCEMIDLVKLKRLDPHFTKVVPEDGIKIIARFPPNNEGIELAKKFCKLVQEKQTK